MNESSPENYFQVLDGQNQLLKQLSLNQSSINQSFSKQVSKIYCRGIVVVLINWAEEKTKEKHLVILQNKACVFNTNPMPIRNTKLLSLCINHGTVLSLEQQYVGGLFT